MVETSVMCILFCAIKGTNFVVLKHMQTVKLNNGVEMPILGFGVFQCLIWQNVRERLLMRLMLATG